MKNCSDLINQTFSIEKEKVKIGIWLTSFYLLLASLKKLIELSKRVKFRRLCRISRLNK